MADKGNEIDSHLGRRLRRRRRMLGLTQQQIADACGVRFQQIQKYECGANRISATRLWQIAKVLDVAVDYFFEGFEGGPEGAKTSLNAPPREALDLLRAYDQLGEHRRRRILDLARALTSDDA
ncbi:MAG TPA: helix-turn-helix transcriptional regulator [Caulobacteraceae bacterium]|nr:helix-turn-helix transcriptional regulator [Caulobacteraceae bacterium]